MDRRKKVGFFGGSFDPFHLGHRHLVVEMLNKGKLDEVWICPTNISPFKASEPPIPIENRIKMIELSIEGLENVFICKAEAYSKKPSYTYETLIKLKQEVDNQDKEFILILSDDLLAHFDRWHHAKKILQEFPVLVAKRLDEPIEKQPIASWVFNIIKNKVLPMRAVVVSSSEIRARLKNKLCCMHLVSLKTLDYIYKYKLYS